MGHLDEKGFERAIAGCTKCDYKAFEVSSYIDRQVTVMLAESNDDGRWAHDGEKFIDGVFAIRCIKCQTKAFESDDCPRCHRTDGLADAIGVEPRIKVPKRCPGCKCTELSIAAFAPSTVRTGEGRPAAPTATALFGEPGYHIAVMMCDGCDWVQAADGCPVCGGPGPLRDRP
jgi:hypothetical protein